MTASGELTFEWNGYGVLPIQTLEMVMPEYDAVAVLALTLTSLEGQKIFITFDVQSGDHDGPSAIGAARISIKPATYVSYYWDYSWTTLAGNKLNGATNGHIEYVVQLPIDVKQTTIHDLDIFFEASA